jgi:AcrR family transcriptional regulator
MYHNEMKMSRQSKNQPVNSERGASARTRRLMMETAVKLMQQGITPSISDAAVAAEVSRATAYRYFPSQAILIQSVIEEALNPIFKWDSADTNIDNRLKDFFDTSLPRIFEFEATFRAALQHSLDIRSRNVGNIEEVEHELKRGHRIKLLSKLIEPLKKELSAKQSAKLVIALSTLFGIEAIIVLKDIGQLSSKEAQATIQWAAGAIIDKALIESQKQNDVVK